MKIDRHDLLGKLSIIKNCLFLVLEEKGLSPKSRKFLQTASRTNEELISLVKKLTI